MIKRLALTIALAGLSGSALAADLRGPILEAPPPLPVPVAAFSWTGGYAGLNVGYGGGSTNYGYNVGGEGYAAGGYDGGYGYNGGYGNNNYPAGGGYSCNCEGYQGGSYGGQPYHNPGDAGGAGSGYQYSASGSERLRNSGVVGGGQIGYNYAIGGGFGGLGGFGAYGIAAAPVIGVEADFDGSGINSGGALSQFAQGFPIGIANYVGVQSNLDYFGTVRGRLGLAFDRLLVYGTGGFAYGQTEASVISPANGVAARSHNFHTGIAYGGGFEFALTNNLLLRAEYLHLDLNRKAIIANGGDPWLNYSVYEKPSYDIVRAGLDYKFDFARAVAAPVIARY